MAVTFKNDIQRCFFWCPDTELVIAYEDMPLELVEDQATVFGHLPTELARAWQNAQMEDYIKTIYERQIRYQLETESKLFKGIVT